MPPSALTDAPTADHADVLLDVADLHHSYGPTRALQGVSLRVGRGEIHGLCGQNGAGKSTLVRILTGLTRADSGTVRIAGHEVVFAGPGAAQDAGIAAVDQELSVVRALSARENLLLGRRGAPLLTRARRDRLEARGLLERVGLSAVDPDASCESLSMPQLQLLEIARLLGRDARLLILDEPTASLSRADSLVIFRALRELAADGHSILYVSHRLDEVLDLCSRVTVLRDGRRVADESVADLDQHRLVSLITGEDVTLPASGDAPAAGEAHDAVDLDVTVPGLVEQVVVRVRPGCIVGIAGQVGSGATEVLRASAGLLPGADARVRIGDRVVRPRSPAAATRAGIAFVSNDRKGEGLFMDRPVGVNLVATRLHHLGRFGLVPRRRLNSLAGTLAESFQVKTRSITASVAQLSGGNQQKVLVGRCLNRSDVALLLLDEPTRGVDVRGRAEIHHLLRQASAAGMAVVFASGDPEEILELADEVVCLSHGSLVSSRLVGEMTAHRLLAETTRARPDHHPVAQ